MKMHLYSYSTYLIFWWQNFTFVEFSASAVEKKICFCKTLTMDKGGKSQYALVYWIMDDKVGIMPTKATVEGYRAEVGATIKMRWRGEKVPNDVEVLKLSGTAHLKLSVL